MLSEPYRRTRLGWRPLIRPVQKRAMHFPACLLPQTETEPNKLAGWERRWIYRREKS